MIEKLKLFYQSEKFPFIVITTLGLIAWLNPNTFLWRDDWLFLSFYYQGNFALFNGHLASEIKPLFQYILFAEFHFAGLHFALYQAINVVILILGALSLYSIARSFSIHRNVSLLSALMFLLHPINFVNAFWIFAQCELLHILFLLLSILYFIKYLKNDKTNTLLIFGFFLFIQNYFFPNGIFFPVLFFIMYLYIKKYANWKFTLIITVIFAIHVIHAFYIQTKMADGEGLVENILPKLSYFIKLLSTSIYRLFIPNFNPRSSLILNLIPFFVLTTFISLTFKSIEGAEKRNAILISLLGLFFSSIILTLTRYNQIEIHYYYSTLHFPYLFIIIAVYIDHYRIHEWKFIKWISAFVLFGFLLFDFKGKSIFALRNTLNKQQMEIGLRTNQFIPFDDPCFQLDHYINMPEYSDSESAVILYRTLKQPDKFIGDENK